jgi:hypothetical protein
VIRRPLNVGRHDGIHWLAADDEFESPIDPLVADASQPPEQ